MCRWATKLIAARYLEGRSASGVQLFLVRCDEFLIAPEFTASAASPTKITRARFIFFCKAALELARRLTPQLQILHVHDWAGGAGAGVCVRAGPAVQNCVDHSSRR